jgi:hypothetical protein
MNFNENIEESNDGEEVRLSRPFHSSSSQHHEKKKKKRTGTGPKLKKVIEVETKVVITKVQRQKRKYVTVVAGLETVPNLKIKDASKVFGKTLSLTMYSLFSLSGGCDSRRCAS